MKTIHSRTSTQERTIQQARSLRPLFPTLAVTLLLASTAFSQSTNGPDGSLVFNGQDGPPPNVVTLSPPYVMTMAVSGPSNQPFVLVRSNALAPGAVPVGAETLDVDPASLEVVMNGLSFSSFINLFASTGPTGTATFSLPLDPTVPPGSLGAFQAAVLDATLPNPGFALTAATELFYSRPSCDFGRISFGSGPTWDTHAVSVADGATGIATPVPELSGTLELVSVGPARPSAWSPGPGDLRRFDAPSTTPRVSGMNRDIRFMRTLHGDLYRFVDHAASPPMSGLMIVTPGGGAPRVIPGTLAPAYGSGPFSRWVAHATAVSDDASTIAMAYNDFPNPDRMFLIRIDGGTFAANGLEVLEITPPGITEACRQPRFVGQDLIFSTTSTLYRTTQDPTTPAISIPLPAAGPFGAMLPIRSNMVRHPVTNDLFFFVGNHSGDHLKLDLATNTVINLTAQTTAAGHSVFGHSLVTGHFALSPNGMRFAYIAGSFSSHDLYLMRTDGTGAPIQVTSNTRFAQNLDEVRFPDFWSDDDVMFYVGGYDIVMDVYNFNLSTGAVTNVTGTNGQSQIPFSANGTIRPDGFFRVPGGAVHIETYGVMFGIDYASLTSYNITGSDVGGAPGPAVTRHSVTDGELCYAPGANIIWFTGSESGNAKVYTFIPGVAAPATAQTSIPATEFTNLVPDVSGTFCLVARRDPGGDEEPGVVALGSGYTQLASAPSPFNEITDGTLRFLDPSAPCAGIVYSQGTAIHPNTTHNPTDSVIRGVDALGRAFHVSSLPAAHWIYGVGQ